MDIEAIKSIGITDEAIAQKLVEKFNESVAGLKAKQDEILSEKKSLAEKYKDIDVEEYRKLKKSGANDKTLAEKVESMQKMLEERDRAIKERDEKNMRIYVDAQIDKVLADNDGIPRALRRELQARVQGVDKDGVIELNIKDDSGKIRLNDKGGAFTLNDLIAEMKSSDDWAFGFKASGNTGGGAANTSRGASGATTMKKSQYDTLTPDEKMKFIKSGGRLT